MPKKLTDKQILDKTIKGLKELADTFTKEAKVNPLKILPKYQADMDKAQVVRALGVIILMSRGMSSLDALKAMGGKLS